MSQVFCKACRRCALPALLLIVACGSYVDGNAPSRVVDSSDESAGGAPDNIRGVLFDAGVSGVEGASGEESPEISAPSAEPEATPNATGDPLVGQRRRPRRRLFR
jgi:hypothetical protein